MYNNNKDVMINSGVIIVFIFLVIMAFKYHSVLCGIGAFISFINIESSEKPKGD